MAQLYADLCTFLARAEASYCGDGQRMQEMDMKKLLTDSKEQFYIDIKRQLVDYIGTFRPGTPTRRDLFFSTLYSALVLTSQAEDALLRKKMLIKTYAWLLANKSKAGLGERVDSAPIKPPIISPQKEPSPPKPRPLRPDMAFVRPKGPAVPLNASLSQKLDEYRQAQMKSLRDLVESRQAIRSWSRAKSRAEERSLYRIGVKAAVKPQDQDPKSRSRPPTVINCKRLRTTLYTIPDIRPKSKLDRAKLRAERLFQFEEMPRMTELPDLSASLLTHEESLLQEVTALKYRLSETCTAVSYKTLACGLVPPRPPLSRELPQGGELLTSNPFLRFHAEKPSRVPVLKLESDSESVA